MMKRNTLICSLLLLMMTVSNTVFAANPYVSVLAFIQDSQLMKYGGPRNIPITNPLDRINIINMTPWSIYVGNPNSTSILNGLSKPPGIDDTTPPSKNIPDVYAVSLAGFSKTGDEMCHSMQIPTRNPNNPWITTDIGTDITKAGGFHEDTAYTSIPIMFNSTNGTTGTTTLNFMVTSSSGFGGSTSVFDSITPLPAISFGDGTNNYAWSTPDMTRQAGAKNLTQFMTLQASDKLNAWKPIEKYFTQATPDANIKQLTYANIGGMIYQNFSDAAGTTVANGQKYDLVVILQAPDYGDFSLIFMAVPSANNAFLKP